MEINDGLAVYWLLLGGFLVLAEVFVPGLVAVFLGLAALLVAGAIYWGLLDSWFEIMTLWFIVSLFLLLVVRSVFAKWAPGEVTTEGHDEDEMAKGRVVSVVVVVTDRDFLGRIAFRESTWPAKSTGKTLPVGSEAVIICREGDGWVIEPKIF